MQNTGEGLTTTDDKMGIMVIHDKVLSICPFYYQVKSFMSESATVNPPYLGETSINKSFEDMFIGNNSAQRLHKSLPDDTEDFNSMMKIQALKRSRIMKQTLLHSKSPFQRLLHKVPFLSNAFAIFEFQQTETKGNSV